MPNHLNQMPTIGALCKICSQFDALHCCRPEMLLRHSCWRYSPLLVNNVLLSPLSRGIYVHFILLCWSFWSWYNVSWFPWFPRSNTITSAFRCSKPFDSENIVLLPKVTLATEVVEGNTACKDELPCDKQTSHMCDMCEVDTPAVSFCKDCKKKICYNHLQVRSQSVNSNWCWNLWVFW